jgi:ppGpp synthetase/RelA/SpoT-type nucleotidyltranferase
MDTELQNQLIADKYRLSVVTQTLGDDFMNNIADKAQLRHKVLYVPRKEKRRSRIISKIQGYQKEDPQLTLQKAVDKVTDFAGGRLLVHHLGDTAKLLEYISENVSARDDIQLDGLCDDCIHTPRETGFRALTQLTSFSISKTQWFPFEIQIMTVLQHDWGEKQHIAYEFPEPIPQSFHESFYGLSERLYQIDRRFEALVLLADTFLAEKE